MKALSIHQPFVSLIVDPIDRIPANIERKRTENRKWFRPGILGENILLHATVSKVCLNRMAWPKSLVSEMPFGSLLGIARVDEIVRMVNGKVTEIHRAASAETSSDVRSWIEQHMHAEGPYCWVLSSVRRFAKPIPYKGMQGLFEVPVTSEIEVAILNSRPVRASEKGVFVP